MKQALIPIVLALILVAIGFACRAHETYWVTVLPLTYLPVLLQSRRCGCYFKKQSA